MLGSAPWHRLTGHRGHGPALRRPEAVSATVGLFPGVAGAVNTVIFVRFDGLYAPGKPKRLAVGASLRKLVMLRFGVLKNRAPFDTASASQAAR